MSKLQIIETESGCFAIDGDLTFLTIAKDTINSLAFLTSAKNVTIDLGRVQNTDSAGLALMIECIKRAKMNRTTLKFSNVPKQLLNLAKLSGLDQTSYFS